MSPHVFVLPGRRFAGFLRRTLRGPLLYRRSLKKFSTREILEINSAVARLPEAIGKPHLHSGLSIRRLRRAIFELRAGLQIRVLFACESGDVVLMFAGAHDEVRAWLRENV